MEANKRTIDSAFFRMIGINEDDFENRIAKIKEEYHLISNGEKAYKERLSDEVYNKMHEKKYTDISDSTYRCFREKPGNPIVRPYEEEGLSDKSIGGKGQISDCLQKALFLGDFVGDRFKKDIDRAEFMLTGSYLSNWEVYNGIRYKASPFLRVEYKNKLNRKDKKDFNVKTSVWCKAFQEVLGETNHKKLFGLTEQEYCDYIEGKSGDSYKKIRIAQYSYAGMRTRQNQIKERIRKHKAEEKNMLEIEKERKRISCHSDCRVENYFAYDMSFGFSLASTIFLFLARRYTSEPVFIIEDVYSEGENKEITFEDLFKRCVPILDKLARLKCYEVSISMAIKIFSYLDDVNYLTEEIEGITRDLEIIANDINKVYEDYLYLRWNERKSIIEDVHKTYIWRCFIDEDGGKLDKVFNRYMEELNQQVDDFFISVYKLKRGIKGVSALGNPVFTEENVKEYTRFQEWKEMKNVSRELDQEIEKKRNQCIENIKESLLWQKRKEIMEEEIETLLTHVRKKITEKIILKWLVINHLNTQYEKNDRDSIIETIARQQLTEKRLKEVRDKTFDRIQGEGLDEEANNIYTKNVRDDFIEKMMAQVYVSGSWRNMLEDMIAGIDIEEQIRVLTVDNSLKKINDKLLNTTTELRMGDRIRNYTDLYAQIQTIVTTGRTISR